jgi:hypothetical protein
LWHFSSLSKDNVFQKFPDVIDNLRARKGIPLADRRERCRAPRSARRRIEKWQRRIPVVACVRSGASAHVLMLSLE